VVLSDAPLPSYKYPPVVETVLSVSFRQIPTVDGAQLMEFWVDSLREKYPKYQQVPAYPTQVERFGANPQALNLEIGFGVPTRFWFTAEDDQHLVQMQPDWIAHNWRRQADPEEYERYPAGRQAFAELLTSFDAFLQGRAGRPLEPVQCEVTYVNHIEIDEGTSPSEVLSQFAAPSEGSLLSRPESFQVGTTYVISHPGDATPVGRLHVAAQSGVNREKGTPIVFLNLTARGRPLEQNIEGALAFCDLGREWVVRSFAAITTDALQERWGPVP